MRPNRKYQESAVKQTPSLTDERIAALKNLFPEAVTEGEINFDKLGTLLGDEVDDRPERYTFSWAGKRDAIRMLQAPSAATLVPCEEESIDFEDTQNVFIEGENLEVLKLLYKAYAGRVKMIYIDPPYNTGNDFIYPDNYADPLDTYLQLTGQKDAEGNLLTSNPETSGRYHSAWLSMMYPRLVLARQLLREDGVIFVSIDDHEVHNLRMLMNEVFGEENFVATIAWQNLDTIKNDAKYFSDNHEYVVCYACTKQQLTLRGFPKGEKQNAVYKNRDDDPRGPYLLTPLHAKSGTESARYSIVLSNGQQWVPPPGTFPRFSQETLRRLDSEGRLYLDPSGQRVPQRKTYLNEVSDRMPLWTFWRYEDFGSTRQSNAELKGILGEGVFDNPKPSKLVRTMTDTATSGDDIVLDFFAGSCTSAHAALDLNREDGGSRCFIMVQLPEPTGRDEYATIADIGKERIRRVIARMKQEDAGQLDLSTRETPEDLGFRVFKLASSNYRPWRGTKEATPEAYAEQMDLFTDPLVEGWNPREVIWEVAIKEGYGLNSRIERVGEVERQKVFRVTGPDREQFFFICLDDGIGLEELRPLQLDAIEAIADLFEGQPRVETELRFLQGDSASAAVPNRLDLTHSELLANLHAVQRRNGIALDPELRRVERLVESGDGEERVRFYNYSVEMETGTGKTYAYLRTALELYRRYGWRKYIIVVPSIAIREGVLKTLRITQDHLSPLYGNVPYRYYVYDSKNISQVRQFALSHGIEIMVMTLAAFNKAANVIRQTTDRLQGEMPIRLVQATQPILILDEPQNMESEKSLDALASLHPLMALRYSATHRNPYNLVYRLTPYEAYRQGLVKRIEVASVVREDAFVQPYIRLVSIRTRKRTITARLAVHALMKTGTIRERVMTVRPGDSLEEKTHRGEYAGYEIEEINPGGDFLRFTNNIEIAVGQELGADKEAIFEAQIRYTVEEHMRKQARLKDRGLKVLSLFFIDRVDNYASQDGIIRELFDGAFNEARLRYGGWGDRSSEEVQAAYFAQRRTRSGEIILQDSKTGEAERDRRAYDLIMKDKERLLSLDEPVAFIFSHSALREGWDNPNVFQICTLNQTASEMKKRQEVGRGVRLAVNQTGERERDERVNILTVVANESYERFVAQLQDEIAFEYREAIEARYGKPIDKLSDEERRAVEAEYGKDILSPKPANARKRTVSRLRKEYMLKPEFKELWERIKHKTRYAVRIDSERLVQDVVAELQQVEIGLPRVTITKARVDVSQENVFEALQMSGAKTMVDLAGRYPLPNLLEIMANLMERTTPPVRLTRKTLLEIIRRVPGTCQQAMLDNPTGFATTAVRITKERLADQLVEGIQYEKIDQWYEMTLFETHFEGWDDYLVSSQRLDGSAGSSLYDHVPFESNIERDFVAGLEHRDDVKLYVKLPSWFTVPTPIGEYNPDWAIVMEDRDEHGEATAKPLLYLVRETKSTTNLDELRREESRKIVCGRRHFKEALGVDYWVVARASDLP